MQELPFILKGEKRTACEEVIRAITVDTMTGTKCRVCLIELFLCLRKLDVTTDILLLIESAVRISELLYMSEEHRNLRNILRLYNLTWLHHELCSSLITRFHGGMKHTTFFGTYLHALVSHAPQQFEIVSLRSVNTENQERLFEQARRSATAASNRHPQNVLYTAVLRIQAKAIFKQVTDAQLQADSIVAKAGKDVPKYSGTVLLREFIEHRERSWQCHLRRISHYLVHGKGVWWKETEGGYQFLDGDDDLTVHTEGPHLRHFRSVQLKEVTVHSCTVWDETLAAKVELPTSGIMLYDKNGNPHDRLHNHVEETSTCTIDHPVPHTEQTETTESGHVHVEFNNTHSSEELLQHTDDKAAHFKTKYAAEIWKIMGSSEDLTVADPGGVRRFRPNPPFWLAML